MTNEEKMVWAAAFGAEYARLSALDLLENYKIIESARSVAGDAVKGFRCITLYESEGDWRGDKVMIISMQGGTP